MYDGYNTDNEEHTMHLSQSVSASEQIEVRYHAKHEDSGWAVQVFFGSPYATLYMSTEEARQFVADILAVLPQPVTA